MLDTQKGQDLIKSPFSDQGESFANGKIKNSHPGPLPKGEGELRVALVHDFLINPGGAEKVLEVLAEMFPAAPIYTLLYDKEKMRRKFKEKDIRTSYLQKFPKFFRRRYQWLLPFYLSAPETFDLRDFDLVISSSGAWAKGIITKLDTIHFAYIHSPMRYVWDYNEKYIKETKREKMGIPIRFILNYARIWDRLAAERPDYLIANSRHTRERIRKYYRRDSIVIYPPVEKFEIQNSKITDCKLPIADYFLVVSRLSPNKKVDLVVDTFNKLELPLVIIGEGKQEKYLRKIAKKNVKILGWQNDEVLHWYYEKARAFIFPAEDDFGIAPVEAMSYGVPVIAFRKGGASETVIEGITGEFFDAQTPEVLADGVRRFMEKSYDRDTIINRAEEFSKDRFIRELRDFINVKCKM